MNLQNENQAPSAKEWKTKREIAGHFKCSIRTISNLMRRRILPYVKIGKWVRFDTEECDRAVAVYNAKSILLG
jgi:hypothetical protein